MRMCIRVCVCVGGDVYVFSSACFCALVCVCVRMYVYVCVHVCVFESVWEDMCVCVWFFVCRGCMCLGEGAFVYVRVLAYARARVCMLVCLCACVCSSECVGSYACVCVRVRIASCVRVCVCSFVLVRGSNGRGVGGKVGGFLVAINCQFQPRYQYIQIYLLQVRINMHGGYLNICVRSLSLGEFKE